MLLFLADDPDVNDMDGMAQRVQWIDKQFRDCRRTILIIGLKRGLRMKRRACSDRLFLEKVNLFAHFLRLASLAKGSSFIYVHSCHQALRGLPFYFLGCPVITDMHGVVPEEASFSGHVWMARIFSIVERIAIKRSAALVFVTNAMRHHFEQKYLQANIANSYLIPVLTDNMAVTHLSRRTPHLVIYAGGLQAWQRIDRMLDAIERTRDQCRFLLLTPDAENLTAKLAKRGIRGVEVNSVPRSEMPKYYARASLGFVLRENSVINRVACPTKLVEYLWAGVVPIVEDPYIGDFAERGYKYVRLQDFVVGHIPDESELDSMREYNRRIAEMLQELSIGQMAQLRTDFGCIPS